MKCPKCQHEMEKKSFEGIEVDRCFGCGGLFLDKGELQDIDNRKLAALIDITVKGQKAEVMDKQPAHCHRCDHPMIALKGAGDITFDWCDQCEGMFFDRGELAALGVFEPGQG
jgi:uncharacterized protein